MEPYSKWYTPDTVIEGSEVYFIAQAPGEDEENGHRLINRTYHGFGQHSDEYEQVIPGPLLGPTGKTFNERFLPLTGLQRSEISIGNAIRCRPGKGLGLKPNDLPSITTTMKLETSKSDIVRALRHCANAHLHIPSSVKLIVAMGRYAMFQLTGIQNEDNEYGKKVGVMESWRGYGVDVPSFSQGKGELWKTIDTTEYHPFKSDKRVFFTNHIASLWYGSNKRFMHATLLDFDKVKRILNGKWPSLIPSWSDVPPVEWPSYSTFDTEFIPEENILIRWSLSDNTYNTYCVEVVSGYGDIIPVKSGSVIVIQNALADIRYLANIIDISKIRLEDMMLADSVLWTGEPHGLNFIASKHGRLNRYKHLIAEKPQLYSAMDANEPMFIWMTHFLPEFKKDNQSWRIYRDIRMKLIHPIDKSHQHGVAINTSKLDEAMDALQLRIEGYKERAIELTGDEKFNLGGIKRMKEEIYGFGK
jgi:hypothetical protein